MILNKQYLFNLIKFCSYFFDFSEKYVDSFVDTYSHVMDGGENPLFECPECDLDTFLCLDGFQYVSLTCWIKPTQDYLTTCNGPRCNEKVIYRVNESVASFCRYCTDYFKHV